MGEGRQDDPERGRKQKGKRLIEPRINGRDCICDPARHWGGRDNGNNQENQMASISIIRNVLSDGSENFDLLIQNGGESVTLELIGIGENQVSRDVQRIHDMLEFAVGPVDWTDMLLNKG